MPPAPVDGVNSLIAAFWRLNKSREIGMAVGPIPFEAVDRYGARYGYFGRKFDELLDAIELMDAVYLEKVAPKNTGETTEPTTPPPQQKLTPKLFRSMFGRKK